MGSFGLTCKNRGIDYGLKTLSSEGKIAYLIKPILKVLQETGGQLERFEIKERIADMDYQIAEYSVLEKKSKQTGNTYKEFHFKFNFAIKDLYWLTKRKSPGISKIPGLLMLF